MLHGEAIITEKKMVRGRRDFHVKATKKLAVPGFSEVHCAARCCFFAAAAAVMCDVRLAPLSKCAVPHQKINDEPKKERKAAAAGHLTSSVGPKRSQIAADLRRTALYF